MDARRLTLGPPIPLSLILGSFFQPPRLYPCYPSFTDDSVVPHHVQRTVVVYQPIISRGQPYQQPVPSTQMIHIERHDHRMPTKPPLKTHLTRLFLLSTINPIKKANNMNNNVLSTIKMGSKM
jgi:hypothetical protein